MIDIGVFKVSTTVPESGSRNILTTALVTISFNTDVDTQTISGGISVIAHNDSTPVKGSLSYDRNRSITFKPAVQLQPGTTYDVIVKSTLKNVLGNTCVPYNFSFTTQGIQGLQRPQLINPSDAVMVKATPQLSWHSVTNAIGYSIQVSQYDNFSVIAWNTTVNCEKETADRVVSVQPDIMLRDSTLYYWRVQPFQINTTVDPFQTELGPLSETYKFTIGRDESGVVSTEDSPYIDPAFQDMAPPIPEIVELFPEMDFSNVGTNLRTLYARIDGIIDPTKVDPRQWFLSGQHITEDPNMTQYNSSDSTTVTSKSIHGEVKGCWSIVTDEAHNETFIIFQPVAL